MEDISKIERAVLDMKSDTISNYIIAGLESSLLNNGKVRLFECSRNQQDSVTPHSHRYSLTCLVLSGEVVNRSWYECSEGFGDFFETSVLTYKGSIGSHSRKPSGRCWYTYSDITYTAGDVYTIDIEDIHSIIFNRGAKVLVFEGEVRSDDSVIIEPVVDGVVIPTYENKDYMFLPEIKEEVK